MKIVILVAVNLATIGVFAWVLRKKNLLAYFGEGRWWLTWLSIAVITLMDELTSIFYAPSEAYRFIGAHAIAFIAVTSLLMRFLSTRMTEIAEILEHHGIRGGGVYSFSYLVLGPTLSFVAVASIMVDYVLTACISTVSAVENGLTLTPLSDAAKFFIELGIVWAIAGLNILGVKENARVTFGIFFGVALVLMTFLASALLGSNAQSWTQIGKSFTDVGYASASQGFFGGYGLLIVGIASCILAYSGIESVVQTAGLVKSWRDIGRAYIFLAVTIGIFTPLISALVLASGMNIHEHETDLLTVFAVNLNGIPFGVVVGVTASVALIMAVNTAFVASSELLERVAHRYSFHWIIKTNARQSLYRIHLMSAVFYSIIIILTGGSQKILAEMYALGLVASFTINMGSLLYYRYFTGTKEIRDYHTSRVGTFIIFIILLSSLIYLSISKPYGLALWTASTVFFLLVGIRVARHRAPENVQRAQTDSPLQMVFALGENAADAPLHVYFKRPFETGSTPDPAAAYVSFYSPRAGIPERMAPNHYRFANAGSLFDAITGLLLVLRYELPDRKIIVHFGWPLSSWLDRFSIGVMVYSMIRLPKEFPEFSFLIEYFGRRDIPASTS
ncbi:MAG TPA: amino acid permease [Bacteroidota bacterium]|nr:amino acid permease [Bacteroidota bacterium]